MFRRSLSRFRGSALAVTAVLGILASGCGSGAPVTSTTTSPNATSLAPTTAAASTSPPASATSVPRATAAVTAMGTQVVPLGGPGAAVFPGTYSANFIPSLTMTIGHAVDLDCSPGYRCRGEVQNNDPDFIDIEFGNTNGSELAIKRWDKVTGPSGAQIDPPQDFAAWIAGLPGMKVYVPASSVTVGGVPAIQFDAQAATGSLGGQFVWTDHKSRVTVLSVDGHQVVIQEAIGSENTMRLFQPAIDSLQPIVDSIAWQ